MSRSPKNQHLVPKTHKCSKCGKTKKDGRVFSVTFTNGMQYARRWCSKCRMIKDNGKAKELIAQEIADYFKQKGRRK